MKKRLNRNPLSYQNILCFTAEEIQAYIKGEQPPVLRRKIFEHLNEECCNNCRRIYRDLMSCDNNIDVKKEMLIDENFAIDKLKALPLSVKLRPAEPEKLIAGQVWSTIPNPKDEYGHVLTKVDLARPVVIIMEGDGTRDLSNIIRVFPMTPDTDFHVRGEDMVLKENNPLGYSVMLEIWNENPMLAGNLDAYLGKLSEAELRRLDVMRSSFLLGKSKRISKEVKNWRAREIALTNYLNFPVNQSIWNEIVIPLDQYRYALAADDSTSMDLDESHVITMCEEEIFSAYIILKREIAILRIATEEATPPSVAIEGEIRPFDENPNKGIYDYHLGKRNDLLESMKLRIILGNETREFHIVFEKNAEPI